MDNGIPTTKRAKWREWAKQEFGDDEKTLSIATDSVLQALLQGYSVEDAIMIARWSVSRDVTSPRASTPISDANESQKQPLSSASDASRSRGGLEALRNAPRRSTISSVIHALGILLRGFLALVALAIILVAGAFILRALGFL